MSWLALITNRRTGVEFLIRQLSLCVQKTNLLDEKEAFLWLPLTHTLRLNQTKFERWKHKQNVTWDEVENKQPMIKNLTCDFVRFFFVSLPCLGSWEQAKVTGASLSGSRIVDVLKETFYVHERLWRPLLCGLHDLLPAWLCQFEQRERHLKVVAVSFYGNLENDLKKFFLSKSYNFIKSLFDSCKILLISKLETWKRFKLPY